MKKTTLFICLCYLLLPELLAQPSCYFEHYSTEDGLPQYTIMDMLQDRKGFMWFATWDGLSKFDGTTFRNFKVQPGDTYHMKSNRIQKLFEDKYGNIWMQSYDDEAHCFNTRTETFKGIQSFPEYRDYPFTTSRIVVQPSGKVWLLSRQNGCFCIADSLFTIHLYNQEKGRLKGNAVFDVFEDSDRNSWILTDNGLSLIENGETETKSFFFDNNTKSSSQRFYTAVEFDKEIWFGSHKGRIWKYDKTSGKFDILELEAEGRITGFRKITEEKVIITTSHNGLYIYHVPDGKTEIFNRANTPALTSNRLKPVYLDKLGQFWFESDELGIYKMDTETNVIQHYLVKADDASLSTFPPFAIILEDIHDRIWVQPKGGGFSLYDPTTDRLMPFYNSESSANWRFSNILHSGYTDRQGNLWLCTRSHGLEKVIFDKNHFTSFTPHPELCSTISNDVRAVFQDKDKNIWVATKDRYLTIYDENYHKKGTLSPDGRIVANQLFAGAIYCIMQDQEENIWIGTKGEGVFKLTKTPTPGKYDMEHFRYNPDDIYSVSDDVIYSIYQDKKGNLWIGTYGSGLNLVSRGNNNKTIFINHRNNLKNYPIETGYRIRHISENKYGNICIGTTMGLIMFSSGFSAADDILFNHYSRIPGEKESLSNNDIHGICSTQQGEMFLATFGGGLNKVTRYDEQGFPLAFRAYTSREGLPSDVCLAVLEDASEKLWISMENNLSRFDPEKEIFETFTEIMRLMAEHSFSEASACRLSNEHLLFGYSKGVVSFSPQAIRNSNFTPYIALSGFRLFNQQVPINEENSPLERNIDDTERLVLNRKQNFFSIEYVALDLIAPDNILYAYKLEGFDNDWNYGQKQRIANYTNIPKGEYVFRVKSTNSEGVWVENERTLAITILPSFWETPWAYALYVFLFIGLVIGCVSILFTIYRLKGNVEMEKQLSEMKLRFFTDISHEIRTPLTMITAPVDHLVSDEQTPENIKKQLSIISQNTNRLLRLVNQIMDFRKVQHFRLTVRETDLGDFVEQIYHTFNKIAESNQIRYNFVNKAKGEKVWVDRDCLEKIVMNLVSNAFKFSAMGKDIRIRVYRDEKHLFLEVKDNGVGISKEKQKKLFTRFASYSEDKNKPSTGIGLHIVKDLVDKHAAKIMVESEQGKGSCFTVCFQRGIHHFPGDVEIIASDAVEIPEQPLETPEEGKKEESNAEGRKSVLIVEDDTDLRGFIRTVLEGEYTIYEAEDGVEGLEMAEKHHPDFIVSDIMMPRMDGIELLQKLRGNINTSHIPIVLLTAKTTIESKLEGLTYGADDYITKPFSVPYFRARVNNLLEQRKRLQEIYRGQLTFTSNIEYEPQPFIITSQDEVLMKKVIDIIERNLDNSDFTVEDLSSEAGMSRSVFFNKVKSLTGLSPIEFIRDIKMKKAAQFLVTGEFMVKEVSYMIGILDTKYFGRCFKAKYGMTPQEYKNQHMIPSGQD